MAFTVPNPKQIKRDTSPKTAGDKHLFSVKQTEGFLLLNTQKVINNLPVHTVSASSREFPLCNKAPVLPAMSRHIQSPPPKASFL